MKDQTIDTITEAAKTAGAAVESVVKNEMFDRVKSVAEPSVAKKVAKRALIGAGVLALVAGGFYGYKALKKTKTIVIVDNGDASNDAAAETPAEPTAA